VTLAARTSLFFLGALAVVLVGLSLSIYILVRSHLQREAIEQTSSVLDALIAAVEFTPTGLEWEPQERRLAFGPVLGGARLAWAVFEPNGHRLDGSHETAPTAFQELDSSKTDRGQVDTIAWQNETWQIARQIVKADVAASSPSASVQEPPEHAQLIRYPAFYLAAGISVGPIFKPLGTLAMALLGISLAIWTAAAITGQWLCRKALAPVTIMAQAARSITAADLTQRLPPAQTGDELEDLRRAFNELLSRLQDSFERQQQFTAEASHQLRTPLTAMLGHLDVALRRDRAAIDYRRALESAQRQAEHLRQIIEMLLFLTREDTEAATPEFDCIDIASWLPQFVQNWEQHPRFHDIHIECVADAPMNVSAHAGLLGQALNNLVDNAVKYSAPGSAIILRAVCVGNELHLSVVDHGCGIGAADLPHLFEPFFRSNDARRRGISGTGLGLAVVHRIARALHGRVEVQSCAGEGSQFALILPAIGPTMAGHATLATAERA
jgi:two-component system, OmpR family, sensor kinase